MDIRKSRCEKGIIGLCGHIGVGHTHSHSGFVQDDSAGFTVLASILKKELPIKSDIAQIDTNIKEATITVKTVDGGIGKVVVRRGITPFENDMMQTAVGKDAIFSQKIVLETFGRIYGQGAMEIAVSFQAVLSLAVLDTFGKKWPNEVVTTNEDTKHNIGKILGTTINI